MEPVLTDALRETNQSPVPKEWQDLRVGILERTMNNGLRVRATSQNDYHKTVRTGLKPSTVLYCMQDDKYKEVIKGLPQNRQVKAMRTHSAFHMQHHASY